jgi:hypothetical protein
MKHGWEWFVDLFAFEARLAAGERETEEGTQLALDDAREVVCFQLLPF